MEQEKMEQNNVVNENEISALADTSPFYRLQYAANNSAPTNTYTSGCTMRVGYRDLSGSLAAQAYTTYMLYDASLNSTITCVANLSSTSAFTWAGNNLVVNVARDYSNNCYRVTIYNAGSSTVSFSHLRIEYIAIMTA